MIALALAAALALASAPDAAAAPEAAPPRHVVVVTDGNYPPFLFRDPKGGLQGIVKDKWALWSERTGVPVEVRGMDWVAAQQAVRAGKADVIETLAYTPERAGLFEFSRSRTRIEARVYVHRSLAGITNDPESMRGFLVGAKAGSACAQWLKARGIEDIRTYPDSETLVKAAGAGKVRLFCMDESVANYFLYRDGLAGEFRQSNPLYDGSLHWAVRAGDTALLEFVERGFERIAPEDLAAIDAKWLGGPVDRPSDMRLLLAFVLIPVALVCFAVSLVLWNRRLRQRLEARARYFSTRDALTELPARPLLHDRLAQALVRQAERGGRIVAVLFVDLDRFKAVNDTFGHAWGDRVLREAARRLQRCIGATDTVARISSDEFVIVLSELARADEAAAFARRVLVELHHPFDLEGKHVYCTASIGIAVHPGDGTTAANLIRNADIAMYRAKEGGRNTFRFFLPEMHQRAVRRLQIETAVRGALEREEFLLHYQPKVDLRTGAITGFEALLRWHHPEYGVLSPAEFIPVLEDTHLIGPVGEWVLREACAEAKRWQERGVARPVAVNLSARQFRMKDFGASVARIVDEAGIDPPLLELELTESLLMYDPEEAARTLATLKSHGVRLSLDDFGTGYSSLAYLRRFPLDTLKIDRAFIADATANPDDAAITLAIINLGHTLGLRVVAEGVENAAQLEFLRANGCDEVQGFLYSPPVCGKEAGEMVRVRAGRPGIGFPGGAGGPPIGPGACRNAAC